MMLKVEMIKNGLDKLNRVDLFSKMVDLSFYPEVEADTCGGEIVIEDVFSIDEVEVLYKHLKVYFENPEVSQESKIFPVIGSAGNVFICLGFGEENKGKVYYFDFDFGCLFLDDHIDGFLSKLVDF